MSELAENLGFNIQRLQIADVRQCLQACCMCIRSCIKWGPPGPGHRVFSKRLPGIPKSSTNGVIDLRRHVVWGRALWDTQWPVLMIEDTYHHFMEDIVSDIDVSLVLYNSIFGGTPPWSPWNEFSESRHSERAALIKLQIVGFSRKRAEMLQDPKGIFDHESIQWIRSTAQMFPPKKCLFGDIACIHHIPS